MKSLKERLEEKIEKDSVEHSNSEGDNGNAQISYKEGAASLVPLVLELVKALEFIEEEPKQTVYSLTMKAGEALKLIEKFLGDGK